MKSLSPTWQKGKIHGNQVCPKAPLQSCFTLPSSSSPDSAPAPEAPKGGQCPELPQAASAAQKEEGRADTGHQGTTGAGVLGDSAQPEPPWDSSPEPACSHQRSPHESQSPHLRRGQ